ncbi:YaiI/YqxD family protein [Aurantimonas sp. VKM B-3413]|uniref:YaiI/YqxD family protein n=1 Tax=Aurantimonas sp. VKM B-3413 TaxID=2779401 RepID=UPI001E4F4136|nr:YaiI/YqxD family protein [Aurantimonas sp. VKM B-3413]MCB8840455.1 YaiI/YqxD family protein [Aurantimonas sp. VKM B-3413]
MTKLLIDADACPVKDEAIEIAVRHGAEAVLVSNGGMRPSRYPDARIVAVPEGPDAADDWIVDAAEPDDVVVTADIPLAARALEKGAAVLGPTGRPFTDETIGTALSMRAFKQHLRETGESKGYNASFTAADRSRFRQALDQILKRTAAGS